ncbi:MAG: LytTR family DNA-binding domain-containing protein [Bacteroidia bacterium]|nr:LytTR family DNA-binding domain-containing protein [Bacteroidia bacterium]
MRICIVEDEIPALKRMIKLVQEIDPEIEIVAHADSISSAVNMFQNHPSIDLALMDIELADGQSFEIFNQVAISCPIIFTTAYDEFALKAFKVNSIDYLLKPIDPNELKSALQKFKLRHGNSNQVNIEQLLHALRPGLNQTYKQRFLVKLGQKLISISTKDIAYFMAADKMVYLVSLEGKKFVVDHSIEELSKMLNPANFFHINRQVLANLEAIETVSSYFNGKLKIQLKPPMDEEVLVSRDKAADFKNWLNS